MELISKEVVKRIIDSGRTREQMLEMVDSVVAVEEREDCISRADVLSLPRKRTYDFMGGVDFAGVDVDLIKELPSVKPKERTGEWQQDMDGTYLCSECGSGYKDQPTLMGKPMFAFCPICGARMTGEEKEE